MSANSIVTSRRDSALVERQLAGHDLLDEVGREQALELGPLRRLVLDLVGQHVVLDGDGGLGGDAARTAAGRAR
jgi:hypothetical protein